MEKITGHQITNCFRNIEDVVLGLDEAIDSSHIDHSKFTELKKRYHKATDLLEQNVQPDDSRLYIVDEASALFLWIDGHKQAASKKIAIAVNKKGDAHLTSKAGRGLATTIKSYTNKTMEDTRGPLHGWLGFFHTIVSLVASLSLLATISGTLGTLTSPTADYTSWIIMIIFWALSALSIAYIILALRRSRRSIPIAIALFLLLATACLAIMIGIISAESYDYSNSVRIFSVSALLFLIACGVATAVYYARSKKVRQAFNK